MRSLTQGRILIFHLSIDSSVCFSFNTCCSLRLMESVLQDSTEPHYKQRRCGFIML